MCGYYNRALFTPVKCCILIINNPTDDGNKVIDKTWSFALKQDIVPEYNVLEANI